MVEVHPSDRFDGTGEPVSIFLDGVNRKIGRVLGTQVDEVGLIADISIDDKDMFLSVIDGAKAKKADDPVNHPKHYNSYNDIEIIQLTEQLNFNRGSAIKYISRAGLKAVETEIQDLEKAEFHIRREIDRLKINAKREN